MKNKFRLLFYTLFLLMISLGLDAKVNWNFNFGFGVPAYYYADNNYYDPFYYDDFYNPGVGIWFNSENNYDRGYRNYGYNRGCDYCDYDDDYYY